ncbi:MAG: DUF6285 domain-containing protein [Actinomycetota bacterium]
MTDEAGRTVGEPVVDLHGAPTAIELVEAVREWLERDVADAVESRLRFHTRVAVNVLAMVERELALGSGQRAEHADRLASLGVADDAALAAAIRDGTLDERLDEVRAVLRADVTDRLRVANPRHLGDE